MKKHSISYLLFSICCLLPNAIASAQSVTEKLKAIGMENIRYAETGECITVTFENNVYRSTYQGIGEAIDACLESNVNKSLQLVALENQIPQLCISLPDTLLNDYREEKISLMQVYAEMGISIDTDHAMKAVENAKEIENPSAWKVDVIVYPELFLKNNSLNKLYTYAVNLSPAIEMGLWKGGKLTAQVVFPIAANLYGEYKKIHPGVMTLSQEVRFRNNLFGRITAGNFTHNRMGAQLDMKFRTDNGRLELGALVGATVYSAIVDGEGWYVSTTPRVNAFLKASVYEPHTNLQFDLQGGRYIYGDYAKPGNVIVEVELDTELRIPKGSSAELVSELMGGVRMNILLANNPREKYAVGDTIPGTLNNGMMESAAKLIPKVEEMLPKLDSILISLNNILGDKSIPATLHSIEKTTANLAVVSSQVKGLMSNDIPQLTSKLNTIGDNFVVISGNLKEVDYAATFKKIDETLANVKILTEKLNSKDNTIGLLFNDPTLYNNLNATTENAASLLEDLKEHPKRYVHFSLFGKKDK